MTIIGTAISGNSVYATAADLKLWLGIGDTTDDTVLAQVLEEASRDIDADTHRSFGLSAAGTVRLYSPRMADEVLIDDCISLSEVATDADGDRTYETVWAATDYDLLPANAAAASRPFERLAVPPQGLHRLPILPLGLRLTGTFGWASVPSQIRRACVLRAAWLFKRAGTPLGTSGTPELGILRVGRWDPDYERLIADFKRETVA